MNRCVCCGEEITEGMMVCPWCEKSAEAAERAWKTRLAMEQAAPKYEGLIMQGWRVAERWCGELMAVVRWVETQMQKDEYAGCEAKIHRLEET